MKRRNIRPIAILITVALVYGIIAGLLTALLTGCKDAQRWPPQASATEPTQMADTTDADTPERPPEGTTVAENGANETPAPIEEPWEPDPLDVQYIAITIYGEAGVVQSKARQAAVGWCILNRVDAPGFPDTIAEVVTAPYQFAGYHAGTTPPERYIDLARDILTRYHREQQGEAEVGRTLPQGWCFFTGDGEENYFTKEWRGTDTWDWTLPDPYAEEE